MVEPLRHGIDPVRVGPYEVMGRLGSGGMGSVYLARCAGGTRLVALKTIRAELSAVPGYRERFAREIEVARTVRSPYTAQFIDFEAEAETPWLATELLPGPDLADVLASHGPLPADSVRVLAAGLAEALAAIHAAGVVHRDVKPSNVILCEGGPRLVDFGVARPVGQAGLTSTGQFVGSVAYASPEQLLAQKVGPRSDMFSLGAVLAEAAGRVVCSARQVPLAADAVDGRVPELSSLPPDLRTVLERCLAREPGARPSPAELPGLLTGLPGPDRHGGRRWLPDSVSRAVRRTSDALGAVTHAATAVDPGSTNAHRRLTVTAGTPGVTTAPTRPTSHPTAPAAGRSAGKRLAIAVASSLAASLLAVTGVALFAQDQQDRQNKQGKADGAAYGTPGTAGTPGAPGATVTVTMSAEPFGDGRPALSTAPSANTPEDPARLPPAAAPAPPTFTRGALGVSRYRQPGYAATVTSVTASGHQLAVGLRARGEADLREAGTTCLEVSGPDGTFTVHPFAQSGEAARPGAFDGTLTFPLLVSGRYALRYSCQDDYSAVDLGTATVPRVGVSRYSDRYFAVVLSVDRSSTGLQLVFASTGEPDLRDPRSSCLDQGGANLAPDAVRLERSETASYPFHYGVMDFPSAAAGSGFTYSCAADYSAVPLP